MTRGARIDVWLAFVQDRVVIGFGHLLGTYFHFCIRVDSFVIF